MNLRAINSGNVTNLRGRSTYQPDCATLARNRVSMARTSAGLSPAEFAAVLGAVLGRPVTPGHVISWETTATPPGDVLIAAETVSSSSVRLGVRSHKFIVGYIGHDAASLVCSKADKVVIDGFDCYAFECHSMKVEHPAGQCEMYVWPSGSVVFHLTEDLDIPSVSTLALWRIRTYADNLAWASAFLSDLTGDEEANASYVLSLYWVHTPAWSGRVLDTALRLICAPRVLLDREVDEGETESSSAYETERTLLGDGYEHSGMRSFGMKGISVGFASWSGVSYFPADTDKALAESEVVEFELALQSIWGYCEHINTQAEQESKLITPKDYGYRFLRSAKSRLTTARPQEKGQYQAMRTAIIDTSGLAEHMGQALELLREE